MSGHEEFRVHLDSIRIGREMVDGKPVRKATFLVNREVWVETLKHLKQAGKFFRANGIAYYFDRTSQTLVRLTQGDPHFARLLCQFGLLAQEPHTRIVAQSLMDYGSTSEVRTIHRLSYMSPSGTIYLRASRTKMWKVTAKSTTEVSLGTDDVYLMADDLGDFPDLVTLQVPIQRLTESVGSTTTGVIAGLPLDKLTSRWARHGALSPADSHQVFLTRLLFTFAASRYSLWPLLLHTGDGGSGKTTPLELFLSFLAGQKALTKALPSGEKDLISSVTNSTILAYDNIDGAGLQRSDKASHSDLICQVATGAEINQRQLYKDNVVDRIQVWAHGFFTARINPFDRPDLMRRTLHLQLEAPAASNKVDRDSLIAAVLKDRDNMFAELILRLQNIVRAHQQDLGGHETQTQMGEYERFTLICAAHEGSYLETQALWRRYLQQYSESLTEHNPIIYAMRLWLGKGDYTGEHSAEKLYGHVRKIYADANLPLPYRSPTQFGVHLGKHLTPLAKIGITRHQGRDGRLYQAKPSPTEIALSQRMYSDAVSSGRYIVSPAAERTMGLDDVDDTTAKEPIQ